MSFSKRSTLRAFLAAWHLATCGVRMPVSCVVPFWTDTVAPHRSSGVLIPLGFPFWTSIELPARK